jgi:hypothetical protein
MNNYAKIRLTVTAAILVVVWFRAHWSIAACLTILAIHQEMQSFFLRRFMKPAAILSKAAAEGMIQQKEG